MLNRITVYDILESTDNTYNAYIKILHADNNMIAMENGFYTESILSSMVTLGRSIRSIISGITRLVRNSGNHIRSILNITRSLYQRLTRWLISIVTDWRRMAMAVGVSIVGLGVIGVASDLLKWTRVQNIIMHNKWDHIHMKWVSLKHEITSNQLYQNISKILSTTTTLVLSNVKKIANKVLTALKLKAPDSNSKSLLGFISKHSKSAFVIGGSIALMLAVTKLVKDIVMKNKEKSKNPKAYAKYLETKKNELIQIKNKYRKEK